MSSPDLQKIHSDLFDLALEAGKLITSANPSTISTKVNSVDLVTETDKAVEDLVKSTLEKKYPDYAFLGEETSTSSSTLTSAPTFVCDPIDGTTNFVHGFPYTSISLAFCHKRTPLVGVVYNPTSQHIYSAVKGEGAWLTSPSVPSSLPPNPARGEEEDNVKGVVSAYTRQRLPLRKPQEMSGLGGCLVVVEWGSERRGNNYGVKTSTFTSLGAETPSASKGGGQGKEGQPAHPDNGKMVHSLRSLGSAALNCCHVASGQVDVYWEGGCWAWDVAAGWIIVEEAGGMVVGGNPGEWEMEGEKGVQVDGRRYLVVRAAEGGKQQQRALAEEFWDALPGWGRLEY